MSVHFYSIKLLRYTREILENKIIRYIRKITIIVTRKKLLKVGIFL